MGISWCSWLSGARIEAMLTRSSVPALVRKPFATTFWLVHPAGGP